MSLIDLALFKQHVRADDIADDDVYLAHLLDVAGEAVIAATARPLSDLLEMGGGALPTPLVHAAMMLAGHWYNQRESVSAVQMYSVPESFQALVKPFRRLVP